MRRRVPALVVGAALLACSVAPAPTDSAVDGAEAVCPEPTDPDAVDPDALLAHDEMQIRFDETDRQQPACSRTTIANAGWPARRHVELSRDLAARGAQTVVASICDPFDRARMAIARATGRALEATCR